MRCVCMAFLIVGCGFSGSPLPEPGGGSGDPGTGGSGDPGGGSGSSPGPVGAGASQCDVPGATLRLCVSFGDNPMARDLLDPPHALADATGVLPIDGVLNGVAGAFNTGSRLRFAESPDFDVSELTIDLWIQPTARPAGKHGWLVDNNDQYFATYEDSGDVRCGIGSAAVTSRTSVPQGAWHHIACSYAAADHVLRVYVDGNLSGCTSVAGIPQGGDDGLAIGANYADHDFKENYIGRLDSLHVYASALTSREICDAAGRSDCSDRCPDGGERPRSRFPAY